MKNLIKKIKADKAKLLNNVKSFDYRMGVIDMTNMVLFELEKLKTEAIDNVIGEKK